VCNRSTSVAESQYGQLWDEVNRIFAGFNVAAATKELSTVFDNLHDEELLEVLKKTRWTGRPGYPIEVLWRSLITSYILDIHTIQELIRTLRRDPFIALQCGIRSDTEVPTRFAYYRFIKKLIDHTDMIEKCMARTVDALRERLPEFGKTVAVDSTEIPTYSDRYRKPFSDSDAGWGQKLGRDGEKKLWLGYKMHLVSDARHEIPLIPIITPANSNDSPVMIPLLEKNRTLLSNFHPQFVLADKGYDAAENHRTIIEDFDAIPIIDMRKMKKADDDWLNNADYLGMPYCEQDELLVFWGYDKKHRTLKYRCPCSTGKGGCTLLEKCSKSKYGRVVKIKIENDYRRFCPVPRHTKKWKKLYNQRVAVERVFSRLKKNGDGKVVNHRMRGLNKITLNCLLAIWTHQAKVSSRGLARVEKRAIGAATSDL